VPEWCGRLYGGRTDLTRVLCFSRGRFVVVRDFMPWSSWRDTAGLVYGLETILFLCLKKEKVLLEAAACCILAISGER
jgi:hypothetical protein